jgi:pimeloyl-ACP methyl ester carboxylesterase
MKNLTIFVLALLLINSCKLNTSFGEFQAARFPLALPEDFAEGQNLSFGYVTVPEFHGKHTGRTMEIATAVFHSYSSNPAPYPLVLLSGGPGDSNINTFTNLLCGEGGKLLRSNRDVVLIEVRGTFFSKPNLICPEVFECEKAMHKQDFSNMDRFAYMLESVEQAHHRFLAAGINLSAFNNSEIAADINMIMETLGYEKYSVFGFSAGTITVQYLLERYPERLHSAILTGVVSLKDNLAASSANTITTLEAIFEICEKDKQYQHAFPDLENRFLHLLDSLNEHPVPVQVNSEGESVYTCNITGDKISRWLSFGMYTNNQIPLTISRFLKGDYSELTSAINNSLPQETFSHGLSFSIMASEFIIGVSKPHPYNIAYDTFYKGLAASWQSPEFNLKMADVWDVETKQIETKPSAHGIPSLMLCAELDHVCPPEYAEKLADGSTNSYVHTFNGLTHTQVALTPCLLNMLHAFSSDPSKAPDDSCIRQYALDFLMP